MDNLGKLPPQAVEIEEAILGALMLEKEGQYVVMAVLKPEDFYRDSHQKVYEAILQLSINNKPIDIKTVTHQLRANGNLESVGGAFFVSDLTTRVNSAANIEYHSRIVKEASMKRELIRISSEIQKDAYEDTVDVFKLIDKVDVDLYKINSTISGSDMISLSNEMPEIIRNIESAKKARDNNQVVGIPSGIYALDKATGGWKNSDLIILAARPGMGKTGMITSIMKNCAVDYNIPVGLFSMEMSTEQIGQRIISDMAEIELEKIRDGKYQDYEFVALTHKISKLMDSTLIIDDTPALTPMQLKSKSRLMVKKHGVKMIMVDYLQLAQDTTTRNREQEISRISGTLKAIAKDLNIPVIALSQLSRAVETRGGDKRPMLSDLRDSGSIEQDADMVVFLYRPEYYGIHTDENGMPLAGIGEIIIAKFRNGRPQTVQARFVGKFTKWMDFEELAEITMKPVNNNVFKNKSDTNIQVDESPF